EAMRAKRQQMQVANDAGLAQTQEQLREALAQLRARDQELQEGQAELRRRSASQVQELAALRSSALRAEQVTAEQQQAVSEQQHGRLRTQLEQAYAARSELESRVVEQAQAGLQQVRGRAALEEMQAELVQ
ncbi:unnamed protein product, partial [Polarella glacialis]